MKLQPNVPLPAFDGNLYQDGKPVGPVLSTVPLPLDRSLAPGDTASAESADERTRYLITIRGDFTVHKGMGAEKFEVGSGDERVRVYLEDSQSVGGETNLTVTLEE